MNENREETSCPICISLDLRRELFCHAQEASGEGAATVRGTYTAPSRNFAAVVVPSDRPKGLTG